MLVENLVMILLQMESIISIYFLVRLLSGGISKVVDQAEWDNVVGMITSGIPKGQVIDGMIQAIQRCSEILLEKGFMRTTDDVNELRDDLRVE